MSLNDVLGLLACLIEEFNSLEGDEFDMNIKEKGVRYWTKGGFRE